MQPLTRTDSEYHASRFRSFKSRVNCLLECLKIVDFTVGFTIYLNTANRGYGELDVVIPRWLSKHYFRLSCCMCVRIIASKPFAKASRVVELYNFYGYPAPMRVYCKSVRNLKCLGCVGSDTCSKTHKSW